MKHIVTKLVRQTAATPAQMYLSQIVGVLAGGGREQTFN